MIINILVILVIAGLVVIAGKKAWKDLRQSRCAGCSGSCQVKPVTLALKKDFTKPKA